MEAAIANIQFDNIEGDIHVYSSFDAGPDVIGFGLDTLAEAISRVREDNHFEIESVFEDMQAKSLPGCQITFEIDEVGQQRGVLDLKVVVDGHQFDLGSYFVFAEGNGMTGLRSNAAIREKRALSAFDGVDCPS
ncbi:hypothetical protein [Rhizobium leguminosarum]|uniref:hypothetical protein n=1 Tax=Rhizobium leguminosarum TaxID=384 RepID=UPI001AE455DB|nr:hypothetical protein [Rhizobium leguminosarum]MBP2444788.1 hypothetical protein [Rhizobium leguminosarum]